MTHSVLGGIMTLKISNTNKISIFEVPKAEDSFSKSSFLKAATTKMTVANDPAEFELF